MLLSFVLLCSHPIDSATLATVLDITTYLGFQCEYFDLSGATRLCWTLGTLG